MIRTTALIAASALSFVTLAQLTGQVARADTPPPQSIKVFDTVTLENQSGAVWVHRGALAARVVDGQFATPPVVDSKARKVTFATLNYCDDPVASVTMTFDQLTARLENVVAYGQHRKKKYAESKAGFAKALALDPTNRIAAVNLASAQQLLGEKADAVKTLAPWLASEPVAMYATVNADPELAPLAASPELVALKAKTAGNVTVTRAGLKGGAAYSAERNLLAVDRTECSWGADGEDACEQNVELFDGATGKLVTSIALSHYDGGNRALVARRVKAAQQTLRDLGFKTEALVKGKQLATENDGAVYKTRFSFPAQKLGVVAAEGTVRVLRGNDVLAEGGALQRVHAVAWAPSIHAFLVSSQRPGSEGCEGTDPTATTIVALPAGK